MHKEGTKKKPPNQGHTSATKPTGDRRYVAKNTMGMGKSKMRVKGAMGKNQETGDGKAF